MKRKVTFHQEEYPKTNAGSWGTFKSNFFTEKDEYLEQILYFCASKFNKRIKQWEERLNLEKPVK